MKNNQIHWTLCHKLWMLKHFENKEFELLNIFIEYLICNCVLHQIVMTGVNVAEVEMLGFESLVDCSFNKMEKQQPKGCLGAKIGQRPNVPMVAKG